MNVEDARHILKVEYKKTSIPVVSHYTRKVIGRNNLIQMNGRDWKQHRDAVKRTFVHSFLVQCQQEVWQVAQNLIATLGDSIISHGENSSSTPYEMDVLPIMKMVGNDVIGKAAFSTDFNCCKTFKSSSIIGAFEYLMNDMAVRVQQPFLPWNYFFSLTLERNRKLDEQVNVLRGFIKNGLQEARIKMKELNNNLSPKSRDDPTKRVSLMDRLVVAHDSQTKGGKSANSDD